MKKSTWPAWYNGPDGKSAIFEKAEDVPNGWTSGAEKAKPEKVAAAPESDSADEPAAPKKAGRPKKAAAPLDL